MDLTSVAPDEIPARVRIAHVARQQLVQAQQLGKVSGVHHVFKEARIGRAIAVLPVVRDVIPDPNIDHSLAEVAKLFFREVHGFHITSRSGGKVVINRTNVAIDLAPYAIPLYNALILVPAALLRGRHPYVGNAYLGAGAFLFAMHLHFSAEGFLDGQPDVRRSGRLFSGAVVLLFLMLWLPCLAAPATRSGFRGLPSFYRGWAGEGLDLARMLLAMASAAISP